MYNKNLQRGLSFAGLSLVVALMMTSAGYAQDAEEPPVDDGEVIWIDDGEMFVIDPICFECSGEVILGEGEEVLWPTDEVIEVTGEEGEEIYIDPMPFECPTEGCQIRDLDGGEFYDNPEIYYNTAGGDLVSVEAESMAARSGQRSVVMQRGPDLCESPAQELVWLCGLVNGNALSE